MKALEGEAEFLANYDPRSYEQVAVAVDVVTLTIRDDELNVLLVQRGAQPCAWQWALPWSSWPHMARPDAIRECG